MIKSLLQMCSGVLGICYKTSVASCEVTNSRKHWTIQLSHSLSRSLLFWGKHGALSNATRIIWIFFCTLLIQINLSVWSCKLGPRKLWTFMMAAVFPRFYRYCFLNTNFPIISNRKKTWSLGNPFSVSAFQVIVEKWFSKCNGTVMKTRA